MENNELNKLRYPVGKFITPTVYDSAFRKECISALKAKVDGHQGR